MIYQSTIEGGQIRFKGRAYKAILLPEVESVGPATASVLKNFANSGGKLIFIEKAPHRSTGLEGNAEHSKAVKATFDEILRKHAATASTVPIDEQDMVHWYRGIQQKFSLSPVVSFDKPTDFISQLHYREGDRDIFFLMNYGPQRTNTFNAIFAVDDKTAWLWDPQTGRRCLYPTSSQRNKLTITLAPSESQLIVFEPATYGPSSANRPELFTLSTATIRESTAAVVIDGPWQVMLNHVNGTGQVIELKELKDFSTDEQLKSFAGSIVYRNHFNVSDPSGRHWLDLGPIHCISEVEVNGLALGYRWYGDHIFEISSAIRQGENQLSIRLVTTLGNYMKTLKHNKTAEVWTANTPFLPMGLTQPVRLLSHS